MQCTYCILENINVENLKIYFQFIYSILIIISNYCIFIIIGFIITEISS